MPNVLGQEPTIIWVAVLAAALTTALVAVRLRWLTAGGGVAAFAVGLLVLLGAGAGGVALLLLFFLTSSALTTLCRRSSPEPDTNPKGRAAVQVLANGGVVALAGVAGLAGWLPDAVYVVTGSLAAATADTWATELGTRIGAGTRLITTWRNVPPGRSGGVSWPGSVAAAAGATLIGAVAAVLFSPAGDWGWLAVGTLGGVVGMIADSFAGASIEARRPWIDNNVVNGICTVTGGVAGWVLGLLLLG